MCRSSPKPSETIIKPAESTTFADGNSATQLKSNRVMINYVLYQNKNKENDSYGKWFARAVHQLMEFDEFIEHMAKHHCVYSEGTIKGVLIEMECCLREMLLEGKAVRFDELGIFSLGISNTKGGAASAYDFNAGKNIESVRMNLYLGKRFLARNLREDAVFREAKLYDIDSTKPTEGENATQPTNDTPSGGGSTGGNSGSGSTGGDNSGGGSGSGGMVID